jgi:hypothetical protein
MLDACWSEVVIMFQEYNLTNIAGIGEQQDFHVMVRKHRSGEHQI